MHSGFLPSSNGNNVLMTQASSNPGISREKRISDDGLQRLEKQLQAGSRISPVVLQQWVKRYGDAAQALISRYQADHHATDRNTDRNRG